MTLIKSISLIPGASLLHPHDEDGAAMMVN